MKTAKTARARRDHTSYICLNSYRRYLYRWRATASGRNGLRDWRSTGRLRHRSATNVKLKARSSPDLSRWRSDARVKGLFYAQRCHLQLSASTTGHELEAVASSRTRSALCCRVSAWSYTREAVAEGTGCNQRASNLCKKATHSMRQQSQA